jgi:hypothetical protein
MPVSIVKVQSGYYECADWRIFRVGPSWIVWNIHEITKTARNDPATKWLGSFAEAKAYVRDRHA